MQVKETQRDLIIGQVDHALSSATMLSKWLRETASKRKFVSEFRLSRAVNGVTDSVGFFDAAAVGGRQIAVMGVIEDRIFDRVRVSQMAQACSELRGFVLRYLMRVSDFRRPTVTAESETSSQFLRSLSWCPDSQGKIEGFGYSQHWYKCVHTKTICSFASEDEFKVIDVREIGSKYAWIVARVRIFDFSVTISPFGRDRPKVVVPLEEATYIVLSPHFIVNDTEQTIDDDGRRVIGRFGLGYAFITNPRPAVLGYGPGQFDVAFQQIVFRIYEDGEIRVKLTFVANRPKTFINLPLAPFDWGLAIADAFSLGVARPFLQPIGQALKLWPLRFGTIDPVSFFVDFTNIATGQQAARQLCISRQQLETAFLVKHFEQHYNMISGALQTWRQIPDWTREDELPDWVKTGVSS